MRRCPCKVTVPRKAAILLHSKIPDIIASVLCTVVAYLVQNTVLPALGATSVAPEVILCALVCCALFVDQMCICMTGIAVGILMDLQASGSVGLYALLYLLLCWVCSYGASRFNTESIFIALILGFAVSLIKDIYMILALYLSATSFSLSVIVLWRCVLRAILSIPAAAFFHLCLSAWYNHYRQNRAYGMITRG